MKLADRWVDAYRTARHTVMRATVAVYALLGVALVYGAWVHSEGIIAATVLAFAVVRAGEVQAASLNRAAKAHEDLAGAHRDLERRAMEYIEFEFKSVR